MQPMSNDGLGGDAPETPWPRRPAERALDSAAAKCLELRQEETLLTFDDRFEFVSDAGPRLEIRFADVVSRAVGPASFRYRPAAYFGKLTLQLAGRQYRFVLGAKAAENVRAIYEGPDRTAGSSGTWGARRPGWPAGRHRSTPAPLGRSRASS
jgi:hypothetical protein